MGHKDPLTRPSPLICFPTSGFETVHLSEVPGEERFEHFKQGKYYPATIGESIGSKYQNLGKIGFGTASTVWLACDLE